MISTNVGLCSTSFDRFRQSWGYLRPKIDHARPTFTGLGQLWSAVGYLINWQGVPCPRPSTTTVLDYALSGEMAGSFPADTSGHCDRSARVASVLARRPSCAPADALPLVVTQGFGLAHGLPAVAYDHSKHRAYKQAADVKDTHAHMHSLAQGGWGTPPRHD